MIVVVCRIRYAGVSRCHFSWLLLLFPAVCECGVFFSLSLSRNSCHLNATRTMRNMRNLRLKIIVYRIEIHNHPKRITLSERLSGEEEEEKIPKKKRVYAIIWQKITYLICDYVRVSRSNIVQCLSYNLEKRLSEHFSSISFLLSLVFVNITPKCLTHW